MFGLFSNFKLDKSVVLFSIYELYWDNGVDYIDYDYVLGKIPKGKSNLNIVFDFSEEYRLKFNDTEIDIRDKLINKFESFLIETNSHLYVLFGRMDKTPDIHKVNFPKSNTTFIEIPFAYLYREINLFDDEYKVEHQEINIDKKFVCLNNNARPHRITMIDYLYKNELFGDGYISLNNPTNRDFTGELKYWKNPKKMILDGDSYIPGDYNRGKKLNLPIEFYKGFFHIVMETTVNHLDISEKTFQPILRKKPFFIFGCPGINHVMLDYGFKPYENIIDYDIDFIKDTETKCQKICDTIKNIDIRMAGNTSLLNTIEFNYNHLINLYRNEIYIVDELSNLVSKKEKINKLL